MFSQPTKRKEKKPNIVLDDSSSDLMDYFEMRRRSNSNQTNCSKAHETDIPRCEQQTDRPLVGVSSRDDETCEILPRNGDGDRTETCVDTNNDKSSRHIVTSYEINGNSSELLKEQYQTQPPRSWCRNLHYSTSSVSQSDGSGLMSQSSRPSRYTSKSCATTGNNNSRFTRSILSTRRKSFLRRAQSVSYKSERKR